MLFEKPVLIYDTREQAKLDFSRYADRFEYILRGTLKTGDYSIVGYEDQFIIERKSLADLVGTVIIARERFVKELERMKDARYAAIMVEASYGDVMGPYKHTKIKPASVIGSLQAFQARYGVDVIFAGSRRNAVDIIVQKVEVFLESIA